MNNFNETLKAEINDFRDLGHKFINKEISSGEFKGISGGMGVYAQKGGEKFMIRLRTGSGIITRETLHLIHGFAEAYHLKKVHLTTRQAVQLHDLGIDEVCDIMEKAIGHGLYTRGGGGNFPRNVSLSPMSGVEPLEAFDVTPYALKTGEYFMSQITRYRLPRKLKAAFSSGPRDSACSTLNDLGFLASVKNGQPFFKLYLAGGLGNNAAPALLYDEPVAPEDILYHVEAMTRLFIAEGDYENKAKARTRYILKRMGTETFMECYKKHLKQVKSSVKFEGIKACITEEHNAVHSLPDTPCLKAQKQNGLYTVILHPECGQLETADLAKLLCMLDSYHTDEIRLSMEQSIYVRNLTELQAQELLLFSRTSMGQTRLSMSVSCIGVPTCQMGIEQSQLLYREIQRAVQTKGLSEDFLPPVHISGCGNSCSRHQTVSLGFAGRKQKIGDVMEDVFEVFTGGCVSEARTCLGHKTGTMRALDIPSFLCDLGDALALSGMTYEQYLCTKNEEFNSLTAAYLI